MITEFSRRSRAGSESKFGIAAGLAFSARVGILCTAQLGWDIGS